MHGFAGGCVGPTVVHGAGAFGAGPTVVHGSAVAWLATSSKTKVLMPAMITTAAERSN